MHNSFPPYMPHATCHALLILLDLIARILVGKGTNHEAPHCSLLHFPLTFSFLGPNIFLSTLSLNTISICSSLSERNQFSHLCEAMCKIVRKCTFFSLYSGIASGKADAPEKNVSNLPGKLMLSCLHAHFSFFFLFYPLTTGVKKIREF